MGFYNDWITVQKNNLDEQIFIQQYLNSEKESNEILLNGEEQEVVDAAKFLLTLPMETLINGINQEYPISSKDIFQYSKIDDAIITLCNILEFEEVALSYEEIGKRIVHAPQQYACIKYGENHAKTAALLSLVIIAKDKDRKCNTARISAIGSIATRLSDQERMELIRRLAIRNPLMKTLIYNAKSGTASYYDVVSNVLFGQTIIRRKHNNEIIMNIILGDDHELKNKIRW